MNTWTVIGKGFAGNDSLLIREETVEIDDSTGQQVKVNGESPSVQNRTTDSALLHDLGAKAAARLCVAGIPRC